MKKIIHISDSHIGFEGLRVEFSHLVSRIILEKQPAENYVVVHSGDLVEEASVDNYIDAKLLLNRLAGAGFQVLQVPGNHDYGSGALGSKDWVDRYKKHFFEDPKVTYPKLDLIEGVAFIGLDSMAEELHWYDALGANGEIGEFQLKRLGKMLAKNDVKQCSHRVLYLHHHPFDSRLFHELKDSEDLKKMIEENIDVLLYGHNHDGKVHNGTWGILRCYDGGTCTGKEGGSRRTRIIDLSKEPFRDYVFE